MFRRIIMGTAVFLLAVASARSQTLTTLYAFDNDTHGANPLGDLVRSSTTIFGTTLEGGVNGGGGVVYSMNPDGSAYTVLKAFSYHSDTNGYGPSSGLVLSDDMLYGTDSGGGVSNYGTVFGLQTDGGGFFILHEFTGGSDMGQPMGGMAVIGNTLFGTTSGGIFSVHTDGSGFTNLHVFTGPDGQRPLGSLTVASGLLYGTTRDGGSNDAGTIFTIQPDGAGFTTLHSFALDEGDEPGTGVTIVGDALYGAAELGGASGGGSIYAMKTNGSGFVPLHFFTGASSDGWHPYGDLTVSGGVIYGTTGNGGSNNLGVAFSMNIDGSTYTNLCDFGGAVGSIPDTGLLLANHVLYGSTPEGGTNGWGTLFAIQLPQTPNILRNGSFESPAIADNSSAVTTPDSWQAGMFPPTLFNDAPNGTYPAPEDGRQYVGLGVEADGGLDGLSQSFTITNAGVYLLSWFDAAPEGFGETAPYRAQVFNGGSAPVAATNLDAYHGSLSWNPNSWPLFLTPARYTLLFSAAPPAGHPAALLDDVELTTIETNAVDDGSFESPSLPTGSAILTAAGDTFGPWSLESTSNSLAVYANFDSAVGVYYPTPFGAQFASFNDSGVTTLRQDLTRPLRAGLTYALTFSLSGYNPAHGFPVQLIASLAPLGSTNEIFRRLFSLPDGSDWTSEEFDFIPPANGKYTLRFTSTDGGSANLDGISIAPIPLFVSLEIFSQPIGRINVAIGADISLRVGAQSSLAPVLQYQWRLNGVNIPDATNSVFFLPDVQTNNFGVYTVAVSDGNSSLISDNASLVPNLPFITGNDNLIDAASLPSTATGVARSQNTNATTESGEVPVLPGNPPGKSIWFKWTAPFTGVATFSTAGSGFDTVLGAFAGSVATRAGLADDDAGGYLTSLITFNAAQNQTYIIGIDGHENASGNVVLSWKEVSGPVAPVILTPPVAETVVSNSAPAVFSCEADEGTVLWFKVGDSFSVGGGVDLSVNPVDDATVGTYYAVVSSSSVSTRTEPFQLQINLLEDGTSDSNSLAYNKFRDAAANPFRPPAPQGQHVRTGGSDTRGYTSEQIFSTVGNVTEPGEPFICGQIGGAPEWYAYTAPTNGAILISTAGSSFDTMLAVFVGPGDSFATLTNVGCGYTTSHVTRGQPEVFISGAAKNQTFYIVVDGYHGASGVVHLNIDCGQPVTAIAPPQDQFITLGSGATFNIIAQGSVPIYYQWQFNGSNIPAATNATLTIPNVQAGQLGNYSVVVTNQVSQMTYSAVLGRMAAPAITTQPASGTFHRGSGAAVNVVATGGPSPAYHWKFNGAATGGNSNTLGIPNFQAANEGTYSVLVSNAVGSVLSSNAFLFIDALRLRAPTLTAETFQLQLVGAAGSNYVLQTSTNLSTWTPLWSNNAPDGLLDFSDTNAGAYPLRFYRAVTN